MICTREKKNYAKNLPKQKNRLVAIIHHQVALSFLTMNNDSLTVH